MSEIIQAEGLREIPPPSWALKVFEWGKVYLCIDKPVRLRFKVFRKIVTPYRTYYSTNVFARLYEWDTADAVVYVGENAPKEKAEKLILHELIHRKYPQMTEREVYIFTDKIYKLYKER